MFTFMMNLMWSTYGVELGPLAGWRKSWKKAHDKNGAEKWCTLVSSIRNWLGTDARKLPDCFNESLSTEKQWAFLATIEEGLVNWG
jgi:hypothetical protein